MRQTMGNATGEQPTPVKVQAKLAHSCSVNVEITCAIAPRIASAVAPSLRRGAVGVDAAAVAGRRGLGGATPRPVAKFRRGLGG